MRSNGLIILELFFKKYFSMPVSHSFEMNPRLPTLTFWKKFVNQIILYQNIIKNRKCQNKMLERMGVYCDSTSTLDPFPGNLYKQIILDETSYACCYEIWLLCGQCDLAMSCVAQQFSRLVSLDLHNCTLCWILTSINLGWWHTSDAFTSNKLPVAGLSKRLLVCPYGNGLSYRGSSCIGMKQVAF